MVKTKRKGSGKKEGRMFLFLPLKRFMPYLGLLLGILMIIFQHSLWTYTESIVGRILIDIIRLETRGKYTISYDKVRFNLLSDQLRLTKFSVIEEHSDNSENVNDEHKFALRSSLLSLNVSSFFDVLINRKLQIEGLELVKPSIRVVDRKIELESDTTQNKSSRIFNLISDYLNEFKIQEIRVDHAQLIYTRILPDTTFDIRLGDITVLIEQFEITNPLSETEQRISSNQFEFELLNDTIRLIPGHQVTFSKLRGSSKDSLLRIEKLSVIPDGSKNSTNINVQMPFAQVTGFDPRQLIYRDSLVSQYFQLGRGSISIEWKPSKKKSKTDKMDTWPTLLLDGIRTQNLDIDLIIADSAINKIITKGLNLNTSDLYINRSAFIDYENLIRNLDFVLKVREYSFDFPVSGHLATSKNLLLDTKKNYLSTDAIDITPNPESSDQFKALVRNIQLWDIDIPRAIFDRHIESRKVLVRGMDLAVLSEDVSKSRNDLDMRDIYSIVSPSLQSLNISDLKIRNSKFSYINRFSGIEAKLERFSMSADDVQIDSLTTENQSQIFGANTIHFQGNGINLKNQSNSTENEISIGAFQIHTKDELLEVDDLNYSSEFPSVHKLEIQKIRAVGLNWYELMYNQDLLMDSMLVDVPSLLIHNLDSVLLPVSTDSSYALVQNVFDSLNINHFRINNGSLDLKSFMNIRFNVNGFYSQINNIQVIKNQDDYRWNSSQFFAENGPFSISIDNLNHIISGRSMAISKYDSTLRLNQLEILPITSQKGQSQARILMPNVLVTGIDLTHLLDSNQIRSNQILIVNPSTDLKYLKGTVSTFAENDPPKRRNQNFKFFTDEITLLNGKVKIDYGESDQSIKYIRSDWLDARIHNFRIIPETTFDSDLTFLDHFIVTASGLSHSKISMMDSIYVGRLEMDSRKNMIVKNLFTSGIDDQFSFSATVPQINLSSKRWVKKLLNNDLTLDSIHFLNPKIDLTINEFKPKINQRSDESEISFMDLRIDNGLMDLTYEGNFYEIPEFSLKAVDFDLGGKYSELYSKDLTLQVKKLKNIFPNAYSSVNIEEVNLSTEKRHFQLKGIDVDPIHNKFNYGRERGFQTDWIQLNASTIDLNGFNYSDFLENGNIFINESVIDSVDISVYRDKNIPFPDDQVRYMPQKMLQDIGFPVTIKALILNNTSILYEELVEGAEEAGFVNFSNLTAGISNITNEDSLLAKNNLMIVAANADFMESGNVQANFEFNLTDPNYQHKYSAFLSEMPISELNKMLEHNVNVIVKSGRVNEMEMAVRGDRDYVVGSMRFLYEDLHLNLVSKKTGSTSAMGPAFGTFFANTFIVNRNNPRLLFVRNGDIYFERDTTRSFFNYLTKATLSGVVSSIGARNNRKLIRRANKEAERNQEKRKKKDRSDNNQQAITKED